tara:strand:- start:516 stop:800 length:285 start_codon:yes stop_codon:yes gene_type:complete
MQRKIFFKDGLLGDVSPAEAVQVLLQLFREKQISREDLFKTLGLDLEEFGKPLPPQSRSPLYCNHANESPATCPCSNDCYCKVEGNCVSELPRT